MWRKSARRRRNRRRRELLENKKNFFKNAKERQRLTEREGKRAN